ncbi:hypothetical protein PR048_010684 [Dryococelus australis]|uniref:Integrase catalytic domain-containing protein n=1 Tax=Dryococelus australis TaxID=614101 RepID=A0ABQ9I3D7_9NEOP|nr:hypothetical protein PR048_010684 [Dryococelus australis]
MALRKVLGRCSQRKRFEVKKPTTLPPALPVDHVREAAVLEIVGVDLAGPLWGKMFGRNIYLRCVHFELVLSLSTTGFLQLLRWFVTWHGRPQTIYSDNGTNFVGANTLMSSIDWEDLYTETSLMRIEWKFSPPLAAWWGDFWERMVQMVKKTAKACVGQGYLDL